MERKLPEGNKPQLHPNGNKLQDHQELSMEMLELEVIQMNSTLEEANVKTQMPFGK